MEVLYRCIKNMHVYNKQTFLFALNWTTGYFSIFSCPKFSLQMSLRNYWIAIVKPNQSLEKLYSLNFNNDV